MQTHSNKGNDNQIGLNLAETLTFMSVTRQLIQLKNESKKISHPEICLNLRNVKKVDSVGVAAILELVKFIEKQGKVIILKHVPSQMLALVELCEVDTIFKKIIQD